MATELKPAIKDGMSQSERYLSSLDAGYFGIDEKNTTDLLKLIVNLSAQFNYYNFSNRIEGNWKDFLLSDPDILIALFSGLDSRHYTNEYKKLCDNLSLAENETLLADGLKAIFHFIRDFILLQLEYQPVFERAENWQHARHAEPAAGHLQQQLKKLHAWNQAAVQLLGDEVSIAFEHRYLQPGNEPNDGDIDNPFDHNGTVREKVILSLAHFNRVVTGLNGKYAAMLHSCRHYIKEQRPDGNVYDPHVALLMSFLHLYGYLQKPVNRLLQKHLDYYYRDIVGMKPRKEIPDKVHLVLEPEDTTDNFFLNKGELLVAETEGYREQLLYALENDVQVSAAQIRELKTIFISNDNHPGERTPGNGAVKEMQVYKGDYPVWPPADFLKEAVVNKAWPLLGSAQSELPAGQRTMTEADTGLLAASPLFFVEDGEREFSIKFFIQEQAFSRFERHVDGLAKATSINRDVLLPELLNQSFVIAITGRTGWIAVDNYVVSCSPGADADCFIEVKFKLNATAEAVGIYDKNLHGYGFDMPWPVIRFLLNNSSFHHPYSFLSYFIIERVTIKVNVEGSKLFKLKNNLGELYSGSPFQPFGPVPAIGAYLDIKNTNIFNRYTTRFSIKINWFDLPKEEGGFETYYQGFNYPFTNGAFKIQLNSVADAKAIVSPEEQQEFRLFEDRTGEGIGRIKPCTTISGIDFKRIQFDNTQALQREWETAAPFYKQGALRLELSAPHEAFGHRLYPLVFTETVMHNAKRFTRDHAIPGQPYVPVIKSLSIDYTLEHAEFTNGGAGTVEEEIMLIHLYPFGYHTFFTGKNSAYNYFVPPPDQESNLLIGLTGLVPGQELSLLFQLSEENFHHSVHEPETVNWSYLVNNRWNPVPASWIIQDTTNSFINTGIVTLKIPADIEKGNTILNPDLYWIRASLPGESSVRSKAIAVFAQAVGAVRLPGQHQFPEHAYTLPAGSVKGFKGKRAGIKEVRQFFPSFNGQPRETGLQYNIRVSERLRHKQRLSSALDITQAVLDAFPQILMVKCYNPGNSNAVIPGVDLHLVVIPREREDGGFISQEPRVNLSLLYKIKKFVTHAVSGFVKVEVGNPVYEKIMVVASVRFKNINGVYQSNGYYLNQMNEDIKKYISPWLYNAGHDFQIGTGIYVAEILNYLQNREYIEYITGFSLVHFYKVMNKINKRLHAQVTDTSVSNVHTIKGSIPGAILISAEDHLLTVIDQPAPAAAEPSGIGRFTIGSGLLVNQSAGNEGREASTTVQLSTELYDFTIYND